LRDRIWSVLIIPYCSYSLRGVQELSLATIASSMATRNPACHAVRISFILPLLPLGIRHEYLTIWWRAEAPTMLPLLLFDGLRRISLRLTHYWYYSIPLFSWLQETNQICYNVLIEGDLLP